KELPGLTVIQRGQFLRLEALTPIQGVQRSQSAFRQAAEHARVLNGDIFNLPKQLGITVFVSLERQQLKQQTEPFLGGFLLFIKIGWCQQQVDLLIHYQCFLFSNYTHATSCSFVSFLTSPCNHSIEIKCCGSPTVLKCRGFPISTLSGI